MREGEIRGTIWGARADGPEAEKIMALREEGCQRRVPAHLLPHHRVTSAEATAREDQPDQQGTVGNALSGGGLGDDLVQKLQSRISFAASFGLIPSIRLWTSASSRPDAENSAAEGLESIGVVFDVCGQIAGHVDALPKQAEIFAELFESG